MQNFDSSEQNRTDDLYTDSDDGDHSSSSRTDCSTPTAFLHSKSLQHQHSNGQHKRQGRNGTNKRKNNDIRSEKTRSNSRSKNDAPSHKTEIKKQNKPVLRRETFSVDQETHSDQESVMVTVTEFTDLKQSASSRQRMIEELLESNRILKSELEYQYGEAKRSDHKVNDLKRMLESERQRIKDLESERFLEKKYTNTQEKRLNNTKDIMAERLEHAEKKCEHQETEIARLNGKLLKLARQEEDRISRQQEIFKHVKKRNPSRFTAADDKLLDVIDSYEDQVNELRRKVTFYETISSREGGCSDQDPLESHRSNGTYDLNPRTTDRDENTRKVIKCLQRQLKNAAKLVRKMEDENELLKLDMDSRPDLKEHQQILIRLQKCEKLLRIHNIDTKRTLPANEKSISKSKLYSLSIKDLDLLPLNQCRELLLSLADETKCSQLDELLPLVRESMRLAEKVPYMEEFMRQVHHLVTSPSAPPLPRTYTESLQGSARPSVLIDTDRTSQNNSAITLEENSTPRYKEQLSSDPRYLVASLEYWLDQLSSLNELKVSLTRFHTQWYPWKPPLELTAEDNVYSLTALVDGLYSDDSFQVMEDDVNKMQESVARGLVAHFQRLFDCKKLSGVYAAMSHVYSRLNEMDNVMNNIRHIMSLDDSAGPGIIVDAIDRLRSQKSAQSQSQLSSILQIEELDALLNKLEEYESFFPDFKVLIEDILQILEVDRVDKIVPTIRSLKRVTVDNDTI